MTKQTVLGRVTQLAKANINALLDQAEDPKEMLDQLIRDYTDNISDAEEAVAATIGNLRLLEQDQREDVDTANAWGTKALAASRRADEKRAAGSVAEADRFDNLAKVALQRQLQSEKEAEAAEPVIAAQTEVVEPLKGGPDPDKGQACRTLRRTRRIGGPCQVRPGADPDAGRREKRQPPRPDERAEPLRGQGAPRGGQGDGQAGARRIVPGRPVRAARQG